MSMNRDLIERLRVLSAYFEGHCRCEPNQSDCSACRDSDAIDDAIALLNAPQSRVSDDTLSGGAVAKAWMVTLCDGRTTEDRVYQHEGHADRMVTDWMLPGRAEYGYSAIIVPLYPHPPITTGGCYRKCGGGSLDYCTVHSGLFIDNAATRCDAAPSAPVAAPVQAEDVVCITKESLARVDDVPWERPIEPSAPPSAAGDEVGVDLRAVISRGPFALKWFGDSLTVVDNSGTAIGVHAIRNVLNAAPALSPTPAIDMSNAGMCDECTKESCATTGICASTGLPRPTPAEDYRRVLDEMRHEILLDSAAIHAYADRLYAALRRPVVDEGMVRAACVAYDKWVSENINSDHSNKAWPEAMRRALEVK